MCKDKRDTKDTEEDTYKRERERENMDKQSGAVGVDIPVDV